MANTDFGGSVAAGLTIGDLNYCRENLPASAGKYGEEAVSRADCLFNNLEKAAAQISTIRKNNDLTPQARSRDSRAIYDKAIPTAQASLDALSQYANDYIAKQKKLGEISAPPAVTVADREASLANVRSDLKMVWDSADDTRLPEAMVNSLREAAKNCDMNTVFLMCGSPDFARKYSLTRRGGELTMLHFNACAGEIIEPILDNITRNARQALAREQASQPGSISWLRQVMNVYLNGRTRELKSVVGY